MRYGLIALVLVLSVFAASSYAAPPLIHFQGYLTDSTNTAVEDDVYSLKFKIYDDSTGGTVLWESSGFVPLQTTNGLFNHLMGSTNTLPDSVFAVDDLWVGVSVDLEPEMAPRSRLTAVPFAMQANSADTAIIALNKTVSADDLIEGTVDTALYSAFNDLASEGKIGPGGTQVAYGDHIHMGTAFTGTMVRLEDTSLQVVQLANDENVQIKRLDVPPGEIGDYMRIVATWDVVGGMQTGWIMWLFIDGATIWTANRASASKYVFTCEFIRLRNDEWMYNTRTIDQGGTVGPSTQWGVFNFSDGMSIVLQAYNVTGQSNTKTFTAGNFFVEYDVD